MGRRGELWLRKFALPLITINLGAGIAAASVDHPSTDEEEEGE